MLGINQSFPATGTSSGSPSGTWHYDESSECEHVSIQEAACYRTERTQEVVLPTTPSMGGGCTTINVPELAKNEEDVSQ